MGTLSRKNEQSYVYVKLYTYHGRQIHLLVSVSGGGLGLKLVKILFYLCGILFYLVKVLFHYILLKIGLK